jgi:hypothetical protein
MNHHKIRLGRRGELTYIAPTGYDLGSLDEEPVDLELNIDDQQPGIEPSGLNSHDFNSNYQLAPVQGQGDSTAVIQNPMLLVDSARPS